MFLQGPECFSIPPEAVFLSDCVFMCVCVCTRWRLAAFVYLKHVGAKKNFLRTTNEQLPYHQTRPFTLM